MTNYLKIELFALCVTIFLLLLIGLPIVEGDYWDLYERYKLLFKVLSILLFLPFFYVLYKYRLATFSLKETLRMISGIKVWTGCAYFIGLAMFFFDSENIIREPIYNVSYDWEVRDLFPVVVIFYLGSQMFLIKKA